jgi:hypothetical protein
MKKVLKFALAAGLLTATLSTDSYADGGGIPPIYEQVTTGRVAIAATDGEGVPPLCRPGTTCRVTIAATDGEGVPPLCRPGTTCRIAIAVTDGDGSSAALPARKDLPLTKPA